MYFMLKVGYMHIDLKASTRVTLRNKEPYVGVLGHYDWHSSKEGVLDLNNTFRNTHL